MPQYWIGLGGNQGDVPAAFREVVVRLAQLPGATGVACSPVYRTAPMGVQSGGTFWNAVAGSETSLSQFDLLDRLQTWEVEFGRVRTMHWGPRTLDLDVLFYNGHVQDDPRLTLPHPGAWYRRFVLDPLITVAPGFVHPLWRQTIRQLHKRLLRRPATLRVCGASSEMMQALQRRLRERTPSVELAASDGKKTVRQRIARGRRDGLARGMAWHAALAV